MAETFVTYMLRCAEGSYYAGHTDNLERRIGEHEEGGKCAYTETRRPVHLIWSQEFSSREEALAVELRIKDWSRAKKEALAGGNFEGLSLAAKKKDWRSYHRRRERSS